MYKTQKYFFVIKIIKSDILNVYLLDFQIFNFFQMNHSQIINFIIFDFYFISNYRISLIIYHLYHKFMSHLIHFIC